MADVITTIGSRSDESISITGTVGSNPYTVSLSASSTADIGDALIDDSSDVYLITSVDGDSLVVLDSTGVGSAPAAGGGEVTKRYYSTIATWESDLDDEDLYASEDSSVGHLMADSDHEEKDNDINGGGNVGAEGLDKITLTVPATSANGGERHDGTHGTGAKIKLTSNSFQVIKFTASSIPVELSWFEVDVNDKNHYGAIHAYGNTDNAPVIHHLIVHNAHGSGGGAFSLIGAGSASGLVVHNCVLYNVNADNNRADAGISSTKYHKTFQVYNCSILSITQDGSGTAVGLKHIEDDTNHYIQNNIVVDITDNCFDDYYASPANATFTNNIASDTSNDGHTNSVSSESAGDLFQSIVEDGEDLRLKSGTNSAVAAGVDLSALSYTDIEIDITGVTRSGDWDIGAHQRAAAAPSFIPYPYARGLSGGAVEMSGGLQ